MRRSLGARRARSRTKGPIVRNVLWWRNADRAAPPVPAKPGASQDESCARRPAPSVSPTRVVGYVCADAGLRHGLRRRSGRDRGLVRASQLHVDDRHPRRRPPERSLKRSPWPRLRSRPDRHRGCRRPRPRPPARPHGLSPRPGRDAALARCGEGAGDGARLRHRQLDRLGSVGRAGADRGRRLGTRPSRRPNPAGAGRSRPPAGFGARSVGSRRSPTERPDPNVACERDDVAGDRRRAQRRWRSDAARRHAVAAIECSRCRGLSAPRRTVERNPAPAAEPDRRNSSHPGHPGTVVRARPDRRRARRSRRQVVPDRDASRR